MWCATEPSVPVHPNNCLQNQALEILLTGLYTKPVISTYGIWRSRFGWTYRIYLCAGVPIDLTFIWVFSFYTRWHWVLHLYSFRVLFNKYALKWKAVLYSWAACNVWVWLHSKPNNTEKASSQIFFLLFFRKIFWTRQKQIFFN